MDIIDDTRLWIAGHNACSRLKPEVYVHNCSIMMTTTDNIPAYFPCSLNLKSKNLSIPGVFNTFILQQLGPLIFFRTVIQATELSFSPVSAE